MSTVLPPPAPVTPLPTHLDLPFEDGLPVQNYLEPPQSRLLTDTIEPVLQRIHPRGDYCIGRDMAIYWKQTDPPLDGCKAPDWYYIPDVDPLPDGNIRRSYVLWQEIIRPYLLLEYASGNGAEERDQTEWKGKFWVYEHAIQPAYYGIYVLETRHLEMYRMEDQLFLPMIANERGHFPIPKLGIGLGIWQGKFEDVDFSWLRWYDQRGVLLPTSAERAEAERQQREQAQREIEAERRLREQAQRQAEVERQQREQAQRQVQLLADKLRSLGVDPESL